MIGQENLIKQLDGYDINTLPHSILLVGEKGCGKQIFSELISNKFNLELVDLTKNINVDDYVDICLNVNKRAYTVDCDKVSNLYKLLKILEETSLNAYFILSTVDANLIESTIKDRCVTFKFKPYSYLELLQFGTPDLMMAEACKIAHTPGQLLRLNNDKIKVIEDLVNNIVDNMGKANFANALSISKKFNYKVEDYDGIDIDLFLNYLEYKSIGTPITESIIKYKKDLMTPRYNLENIMESFIVDMWERTHESN